MLTGNLVRVRQSQGRVIPLYLNATDAAWLESAETMLELFRKGTGRTRGELEAENQDLYGSHPLRIVYQGLAKLLDDRSEFETISGLPPEELRDKLFSAAAACRRELATEKTRHAFDRARIIIQVAEQAGIEPAMVDQGLFADLKSQQRLVSFKDMTAKRLLERYNVGLAQAVLLRSTQVRVLIRSEAPERYRQLLRIAKFHRLICEIERAAPDAYRMIVDGPLSLFTATQKYGVQLAMFLPAILFCRDFELEANLLWGPQKKPKTFTLSPAAGLVSHLPETGTYVPPELRMFVDLFRKTIADWEIDDDAEIVPLTDGYWVPDFRLTHRLSGQSVLLEVLGFWRRANARRHLERLRTNLDRRFLLAVSDKLCIDEADLEALPAGIHRFRQMPLPDEIARLASELIA